MIFLIAQNVANSLFGQNKDASLYAEKAVKT
jgi:hypothetical protein